MFDFSLMRMLRIQDILVAIQPGPQDQDMEN